MEQNTDLYAATKKEKLFMRVILVLLASLWILPLYSVLKDSLKTGGISNYGYIWTHPVNNVAFPLFFLNSAICAIGSSSLVIAVSALAGFAFAKIKFKGKGLIYNTLLMCLAVSYPIIIVPFFFILKSIHLYNTYWAVILPELTLTMPLGVLMLKNFFDGLPSDLMESAFIDGANIWQMFLKIYLPMSKPALINLGILQVMWSFQDYMGPTMYLTKAKLYTATVAINSLRGLYGAMGPDFGRYNAALVLIALPAILIFVFAQKYIVGGITSGAVKD